MLTKDMVKRRLLFDAMNDPIKASNIIGLIGVSEEGAEVELEESLRRLAKVGHIAPMLDDMAEWLADVATGLQASNLGGITVPDGFLEEMNAMFQSMLMGSLVGAFSVLNDLDVITINHAPGCNCHG